MGSSGCPASAPLQFLRAQPAFSTNIINISWTANAANNNGNDTGVHIYTTS